jgi:hypothetical protein
MKEGVPYTITTSNTKWLVYEIIDDNNIRIGTLSRGGLNPSDMIKKYGLMDNRIHGRKRFEDDIRLFGVNIHHCKPYGNNKVFKEHLLQGDIWEEEPKTWSRGKPRYTSFDDDWLPFPSDLGGN